MLQAEVNTEGYRGPVAARVYGYVGLAAYQAAYPGFENNFSPAARYFHQVQWPGLPERQHFDGGVALNECYWALMQKYFMSSPENLRARRDQLKAEWDKRLWERLDEVTLSTSRAYGQEVAEAVYRWSTTDSLGNGANHHNYDRDYVPPVGEGRWVTSPDFPMPALLPYWGKVRPFVIRTEDYLAKPTPEFSSSTAQVYHVQALEIVSLSKPLSAENQWIAEFWNDDRPGLTFSPAGHWLAIANQVIQKSRPSIEKALETYLKVGIALNDAMVSCWNSKYTYNLERPETYIKKYIDPSWRPFSPSPSFPSYPSGHAMMGAAAAAVLTELYGEKYRLTDRSHEGLKDFVVKPRSFNSFDEMARENAISRVFLGVHWRFDCEEGLRLGKLIGERVQQLKLEKELIE